MWLAVSSFIRCIAPHCEEFSSTTNSLGIRAFQWGYDFVRDPVVGLMWYASIFKWCLCNLKASRFATGARLAAPAAPRVRLSTTAWTCRTDFVARLAFLRACTRSSRSSRPTSHLEWAVVEFYRKNSLHKLPVSSGWSNSTKIRGRSIICAQKSICSKSACGTRIFDHVMRLSGRVSETLPNRL